MIIMASQIIGNLTIQELAQASHKEIIEALQYESFVGRIQ